MTTPTTTSTHGRRKPELLGQTVVVIGGIGARGDEHRTHSRSGAWSARTTWPPSQST